MGESSLMGVRALNSGVGGSSPSPPTYDSKPEINTQHTLSRLDAQTQSDPIRFRTMPLCLNPQCQKRISTSFDSCPYCGGKEIGQFNSYSKQEALEEEITIENFHKVVKNSQPFIERTIVPKGSKGSFKSKLIVRYQYLVRKVFKRR